VFGGTLNLALSILRENVNVSFFHFFTFTIDFLFLKDHRSLDYVNLISFIQVLSYCYWTNCPPLTLLICRSPIPKRASGTRFFHCLLRPYWPHWLHSAEWGQKVIPTLSFKMLPLLLNVVHW